MNAAFDHHSSYIADQLTSSCVTLAVYTCSIRSNGAQDIILIKKDSIVLLSQELNVWHTETVRKFRGIVQDAVIVRRPAQHDAIAVALTDGSIQFIYYQNHTFTTVHEIRSPVVSASFLDLPGRHLAFEPRGEAFCSLTRENELTILYLARGTQLIDLTGLRRLRLKGYLLSCCFLNRQDDNFSVVVSSCYEGRCCLSLQSWHRNDTHESLERYDMTLTPDLGLCLFMLPLSHYAGSFLYISSGAISLISDDHFRNHTGIVHTWQKSLDKNFGIPSATIELQDKYDLALIACDNSRVYLVKLEEDKRLTISSLGIISFPATSLALLRPRSSSSDPWTVFATGDAGLSAVFQIFFQDENILEATFVESLPVIDLLAAPSCSQGSVVTGRGGPTASGHLAFHTAALSSELLHEVQIHDPGITAPKQLFVAVDRVESAIYILLSLPWASQVLQCSSHESDELYDVTDDLDLRADVSSLLFFPISQYFIQVTSEAVYCCGNILSGRRLLLACAEDEIVILAASWDEKLALIVRVGNTYKLLLMQFFKSENIGMNASLLQGPEIAPTFLSEPTALHFSADRKANTGLVLLCCANGRVVMFRVTATNIEIAMDDSLSLCEKRLVFGSEEPCVPLSCTILYDNDILHLLVSLQSGKVAHFSNMSGSFELEESAEISKVPISFCSVYASDKECYIKGNGLACLKLCDNRIISTEIDVPASTLEAVNFVQNPFQYRQNQDTEIGLLFLQKGWLSFAKISRKVQDLTRVVSLNETPRRLLYLNKIDSLVVATGNPIRPDLPILESSTTIANLQVVKDGRCISDSPIRDTKRGILLFRPDDVIYCLMQWDVTINTIQRSWTLIGSARKNPKAARSDGDVFKGKLTVLRLKMVGGKLDVRKEFSPSFAEPIYALCALGPLSLVIAHGLVIEVSTLDIVSRSLVSQTTITLRSITIALHASNEYIFAATQKDSLIVFKFLQAENKLIRVASDPVPRLSLSLTAIQYEPFVLVLTDKNKHVVVFDWDERRQQLVTNTVLEMPSVIVKARSLPLSDHKMCSGPLPFGLERSIILAAGLDGSLHAIVKVSHILHKILIKQRDLETNRFWKDNMLSDLISITTDDDLSELGILDSQGETNVAATRARLRTIFEAYDRRALA